VLQPEVAATRMLAINASRRVRFIDGVQHARRQPAMDRGSRPESFVTSTRRDRAASGQ
jgi:hypothetical protein